MISFSPSSVAVWETGARLIASGGGGQTWLSRLLAEQILETQPDLKVVSAGDLPPEATCTAVGLIGSVEAFQEKPSGGWLFHQAVTALDRYTGNTTEAVATYEAAGANAMLGIATAATAQVPLLDADLMGRAFHSMAQTSFTASGLNCLPAVVVGSTGMVTLFDGLDNDDFEATIRPILQQFGGWGAFAGYQHSAATYRDHALGAAYTRLETLGAAYLTALAAYPRVDQAVASIAHEQGIRYLGGGYITHCDWSVTPLRASLAPEGRITLALREGSSFTGSAQFMRIDARHEFLLCSADGVVLAQSPDSITVVNAATGLPLETTALRPGMRVDVLAVKAHERWSSDAGLHLSGPAYHGFRLPQNYERSALWE